MKVQELIERQAALLTELEQVDKALSFSHAEATPDGVRLDCNAVVAYADVSRFIEWLQSLVGEVEPTVATVDGRPVEKGEVRFHGKTPTTTPTTTPERWPIWCANRVSVWGHVFVESMHDWSFRAPNRECAEELTAALRSGAKVDFASFAARWKDEEVQA
jgi:hypothetical protein